tara:strand:- start:131 stop:271 length:141 start_codon:yes stop_codon:yes gene_type:complete
MVTGNFEEQRCVYENGSRKAILQSILKKGGFFGEEKTAATPLPPKD